MRKSNLKFRALALLLALILPLLGLSLTGCTAQDAVDIAAGIAEIALDAMEDTDSGDLAEEAPAAPDPSPDNPEPVPQPEPEPISEPEPEPTPIPEPDKPVIDKNGSYDDRDNVALYLHTYGKLPPNYITKAEAQDLGWEGGSVERYAPGKCIGGMKFGNYEGLLPQKSGRQYYECDIDTLGQSSRGAKRIVYSNDGLIYYTDDHYESFELLYGEE